MKDQVKSLFPSRTQHSRPEYQDWQTVLDLITFVYLLNRDAPIYTVYRGARNLRATINAVITLLQAMHDLADDRQDSPTTLDLEALNAARRTLLSLGNVMLDRGVGTASSDTLQKFNDQLGKSLDTMKEGIGAEVSPEEAKTQLLESLAQFKIYEALMNSRTGFLETGLSSYTGMNLRGSGLADISERSERLIRKILEEAALGGSSLKQYVDQLIAIQSSVNSLSKISPPDLSIVSGTGAAAGTGTAGTVINTRSGPWEFESGTSDGLDLVVDGVTLSTITLPSGAKAWTQTSVAPVEGGLTPPPASGRAWLLNCTVDSNPSPVSLKIRVDDGTVINKTVTLSYKGALPGQPAYLGFDEIDTAFTGITGLTKTNPSPGVVKLERSAVGATKSFRTSANTFSVATGAANLLEDIGLADSGEFTTLVDKAYRGSSISSLELVTFLQANEPKLSPVAVYSDLISGDYGELVSATAIEIYKIEDTGSGLDVVSGSRVVTSDDYNFVGLGVEVGDKIQFDSQTFGIAAVDESSITLDAGHTSTTGSYNFTIFPDTSAIQTGDMVEVTTRNLLFTAYHRISGYSGPTLNVGDGFIQVTAADFNIFREQLTLNSKKLDTSSAIRVLASSTSNSEFSYPTTEQRGTVDQWADSSKNFTDYTILEDDLLRVASDEEIESVSTDLTLKEEIDNSTAGAYSIINPDRESHDSFDSSLTSWRAQNLDYSRQLDEALNFIVQGYPLPDAITSFQNKVNLIITAYQDLLGYIDDFSVRRIIAVDDCFKLLQENSYDRGRDLLIFCAFENFFSLEAEEATYQGNFQTETQEFAQSYVAPDPYVDPRETELQDYARPDLESADLGLDPND